MITGIKEFKQLVKNIEKDFEKNKKNINMDRATQFREFAIDKTRKNNLGLKPISEATVKIQENRHPRMFNSGELLDKIFNKPNADGSVSSGYFPESGKIGKLPAMVIAALQTNGYKIPADINSIKGKRVRGFLATKGIFLNRNTKWLNVPPSPFLFDAARLYEHSDIDIKIVKKWARQIVKKRAKQHV